MKKVGFLIAMLLMVSISAFGQTKTEKKVLSENERMAWWRDAGFGMFIHWGLYSVPAGNHKGDNVRGNAEWIMDKLDIPVKEYEQFVHPNVKGYKVMGPLAKKAISKALK